MTFHNDQITSHLMRVGFWTTDELKSRVSLFSVSQVSTVALLVYFTCACEWLNPQKHFKVYSMLRFCFVLTYLISSKPHHVPSHRISRSQSHSSKMSHALQACVTSIIRQTWCCWDRHIPGDMSGEKTDSDQLVQYTFPKVNSCHVFLLRTLGWLNKWTKATENTNIKYT